ncbi:hypothetical protein SAMN05421640_1772 [Ekhidna lutea]|uniref:Uncharacterized protein n=1 Tax=Ekhidna lutea TaxID=447679 RepID=A0A239ITI1_EKHLU|nr:hypothetical protein SAMN05421640_1772 [Ekhidna lutea]
MYRLKNKAQKKAKELTPPERIQWLLDFIEIQAKINPMPKTSSGHKLKRK